MLTRDKSPCATKVRETLSIWPILIFKGCMKQWKPDIGGPCNTSLQEYVFTCTLCQMTKRPLGLHPAPLEPLPVFDPFDLWITDALGHFLQTLKATYTFWYVATPTRCGLRRYYSNLAMSSRLQKHYIQIFTAGLGCPRTFSDRRTNFTSKFNERLMQTL